MKYFLATLVIFCLIVFIMSVGVIFSNKKIQGSCGGLNKLLGRRGIKCDSCEKKDECKYD